MDLDEIKAIHADFATLIDYCAEKRPPGAEATRLSDLDLMELYVIASRMVIMDVERQVSIERRYRWRYCGTELGNKIGLEMTGKYLADVVNKATLLETAEEYDRIIDGMTHSFWRRTLSVEHDDRSHIDYSRLVMPLIDARGVPAHLIGVYVFDRSERWRGGELPRQWRFMQPK